MTRSAVNYWYYFDIETTGLDEEESKIITIQYQPLYYDSINCVPWDPSNNESSPNSELTILKEWESDEKTILQKFYDEFLIPSKSEGFEPIGNNLSFEGKFLKARMLKHGIIDENKRLKFGQLKGFDLRPVAILINGGEPNYAKFFGKVGEGKNVPVWYNEGNYDEVIRYIQDETSSFIKMFYFLLKKLPDLKNEILELHSESFQISK